MSVEMLFCIPREIHLADAFYSKFLLQGWRIFRIFYLYVISILIFMQLFRYMLLLVYFSYKKLSLSQYIYCIQYVWFCLRDIFVYGSIPIFSGIIMSSSDRLSLSLQVNSTNGALRPIQRLKCS